MKKLFAFFTLLAAADASACPNLSGTYLQKIKMGQANILSIRQKNCEELFVAHSQISQDDLPRGLRDLHPAYKLHFLNADRAEFREQCNDAVDSSCVDDLALKLCQDARVVPREFCASSSLYFVKNSKFSGNASFMQWLTWLGGSAGTAALTRDGDLQVTYQRAFESHPSAQILKKLK